MSGAIKAQAFTDAVSALKNIIQASLEDDKAENIVTIDLRDKADIADYMVIASGRSSRHVGSIATHIAEKLKEAGFSGISIEGMPEANWVLVDSGDVIVHVFKPEVREYYGLEKMWAVPAVEAVS